MWVPWSRPGYSSEVEEAQIADDLAQKYAQRDDAKKQIAVVGDLEKLQARLESLRAQCYVFLIPTSNEFF